MLPGVPGPQHACADCTVAHFGGTDADVAPVTLHAPASSAAFSSCTFAGNMVGDASSGVIAAHASSAVQLQGCAFSNNSGPGHILANPDGEAAFYSDTESVRDLDNKNASSSMATLLPLSASGAEGLFLSDADGWFAANSPVRHATLTTHHSHDTARRPTTSVNFNVSSCDGCKAQLPQHLPLRVWPVIAALDPGRCRRPRSSRLLRRDARGCR